MIFNPSDRFRELLSHILRVLDLVDYLDPLLVLMNNLVEIILLVTTKDGEYDINVQSFEIFFGASSFERTEPNIVKNVIALLFDAIVVKSQCSG